MTDGSGSQEHSEKVIERLRHDTVRLLLSSQGDPERLRATLFLYLNKAYEARMNPEEITNLLGVGPNSVMTLAALSKDDEETLMKAFETMDPIAEQVHKNQNKNG